jgi:hypothetical protein
VQWTHAVVAPAGERRLGLQPGDQHGYGHLPHSGWSGARARRGANVSELAPAGPAALDPTSGPCRFVGVPARAERVASATSPRECTPLAPTHPA